MKFSLPTKVLLALAAVGPVSAFAASPSSPVVATWQITTYDTVTTGGLVETSQTSALGNIVKIRSDGFGRTIEQVDALGNVSFAQYDNNGNLVKSRDANGTGQDCTYDEQNHHIIGTDTHGETRTIVYSVGGLVLNQKDAKNVLNMDNAQYDARGRLILIGTRLLNDQTAFAYDANSNKLTMTDGEGKTTTYAYDNRNLKTAWTFPGQTSTTRGAAGYDTVQYQYDEAERLVAFLRQDGTQDNTTYNFNGTVANKTYLKADGGVESTDTYTYDASNRLLTAYKNRYNNTVSFAYDAIGRKASESLTTNGQAYTTAYGYDADNRNASITYPDGKVVTRAYTERNQLASVVFDGQNILTVPVDGTGYDAGGREIKRILGNGASQARTYRSDNLVATMSTTLPGGADDASSLTYGYDQNKNLTAETYGGTTLAAYSATMEQDAKDRLTQLSRTGTGGAGTVAWSLTKEGDWASVNTYGTTETRTHNDSHQIVGLSSTTNSPTYDAQGDLASDEQARVYTWDQEKNLASVAGGSTNVSFAYDALGRRVSKTSIASSTPMITIYVSAGNQEIAEYAGGTSVATPIQEHVYGTYVDENLATKDSTNGWRYRLMDRRYSTTALLDNTGAVVERYVYDAYGKTTALDAGGVATGAVPLTDVLWTGRRLDGETGNYYFRSRYFSVMFGRFISRDVDYLDGWNLYDAYFAEHEDIDPSGAKRTLRNCTRFQRKINIQMPSRKLPYGSPEGVPSFTIGIIPFYARIGWKIEGDVTANECEEQCGCDWKPGYKEVRGRARAGANISLVAGFEVREKLTNDIRFDGYLGVKAEVWGYLNASLASEHSPCTDGGGDDYYKICGGLQARGRISGGGMFKVQTRWWSWDVGGQIYGQLGVDVAQGCLYFDKDFNYVKSDGFNKLKVNDAAIYGEVCLGVCYRWRLY